MKTKFDVKMKKTTNKIIEHDRPWHLCDIKRIEAPIGLPTERPWRVAENNDDVIVDSKGIGIAEIQRKANPAISKANIRFIVRAVNAHEELVKALERIIELNEHPKSCRLGNEAVGHICDCGISIAKETIAKAEGRE